ncbi:MAG: Co2+/Mg2+ efflux protein ApaG [Gammaproteobacteria bacterium]|nr:Co2+/Mg2+ efflux protein ApaG [Gammaproteobacteria bacterium]
MQTDHEISIRVETSYIESQSAPANNIFAFSYTISIQNSGKTAAKLLNRHWVITDADGKIQEVRGEGVVGEQPHLQPGEAFRYTSGTLLATPVGSMQGEYEMVDDSGQRFLATIPPFSLARPNSLH